MLPGPWHRRNPLSANFPASDPLVLGVGGTRITNLVERPGEVVWNDRNGQHGAGGGGKSKLFSMPGFQTSFLHVKKGVREVPDVAADADPETGFVVFYHNQWAVIGGTSAAAPLWASLMALTDSKCPASPMGWVNPLVYFTASPKVKAVVLNDIAPQNGFLNNNDYTGKGHGNYPVKKGYDMATGLGSPVEPRSPQSCAISAPNRRVTGWRRRAGRSSPSTRRSTARWAASTSPQRWSPSPAIRTPAATTS